MTQKQLITANNAELEKHKQDILSLPMADDVKNGKYVWKKSKREIDSVEVKGSYTESKANRSMLLSLGIALFDSNKKYIGKPNEEIFPDGATNVYILAPATDNSGHVIEGETVYHIVGYSMGNPNLPDVKKYNDFTINHAETFISYVVSDSETAHPDGGEKDGFWWERVKQGLSIAEMGFTKLTYGSFILSEDNTSSYTITHNLGAKLKKLIVYTEDSLVRNNYGIRQLSLVDRYTSYSGNGEEYYFQYGAYQKTNYLDREGFSTFEGAIHRSDVTTSKVTFRLDTVNYLVGGKKYYWMAMA